MIKFLGILAILGTFLFVKTHFTAPHQVDVLFCPYDVGDSNPMKKVMYECEKQGITYKILPFGKAQEVFDKDPHLVTTDFPDTKWDREKTLNAENLTFIKNKVKSKIVIAGMASAIQAQVLNALKDEKAYAIAIYDNFDSVVDKEYVQAFLKHVKQIDEYFLPSQTTLPGFQTLEKTRQIKLNVLGQPFLEDWDEIFSKTDKANLKQRLGLQPLGQVILFVGGYDDTYKEYFQLFVKAMRAFKDNNIKVLVTYHPKTDGSLEKSVIEAEKADNIIVIDKNGPSTAEIATVTDILCCHKSSVGIQALYAGVPVIYVVKKGELNNFAIKKGLALEIDDTLELIEAIKRILSTANRNQAPTKDIGIPKDATKNMVKRIKELLNNVSPEKGS
ncbi:MAG: hypothetical protein K2W94_04760 [Alphaproteobacteria bacterium]|nr:hypothetical protein [Alphaproteobacteria bacterium]